MTAKIHAEKRQAKGNEEMERILLEQAEKLLLSEAGKITDTEEIPLWDAAGRVLSENISAHWISLRFRVRLWMATAPQRGIAGVSSENPAFLRVIDEVTAGHWCDKAVTPGTAVRIMTGAPIPDGADCVVMQEYTNYGEDVVEIYKPVQGLEKLLFPGRGLPCRRPDSCGRHRPRCHRNRNSCKSGTMQRTGIPHPDSSCDYHRR